MRRIDISDETYARLQALAKPFEDTPEDVIRRLLNSATTTSAAPHPQRDNTQPAGADLVSHVGRVPHGSLLRARYKGQEYNATVSDGRVLWNDRPFSSLSAAAVAVINSTGSSRGTENGWRFWEVLAPGSDTWKSAMEFVTSK